MLELAFDNLIETEVISEEAFIQWSTDKTEVIGKAIASMSVSRFFVSLLEGQ